MKLFEVSDYNMSIYKGESCMWFCKRGKTSACPNSDKCYALEDKPYFELDVDKLKPMDRLKLHIKGLGKKLWR